MLSTDPAQLKAVLQAYEKAYDDVASKQLEFAKQASAKGQVDQS